MLLLWQNLACLKLITFKKFAFATRKTCLPMWKPAIYHTFRIAVRSISELVHCDSLPSIINLHWQPFPFSFSFLLYLWNKGQVLKSVINLCDNLQMRHAITRTTYTTTSLEKHIIISWSNACTIYWEKTWWMLPRRTHDTIKTSYNSIFVNVW